MAFKLSSQACEQIARNDYSLAYQEELERLRLELEQPMDMEKTNIIRGQIIQLRQQMKLKDKALNRLS